MFGNAYSEQEKNRMLKFIDINSFKFVQEDFIVDLVLVLAVAAGGGLLAAMPSTVLLGYLLSGVVVGPAGLGLIKR